MNRVRVLSLGLTWLAVAMVAGCSLPSRFRDSRVLDLTSLLLTADDVAPGWSTEGPAPRGIESYRSTDSTGIVFVAELQDGEEIAFSQWVYRFATPWQAQLDYSRALNRYTLGGYTPSGWPLERTYGDESTFSCYEYSNLRFPVCAWIARYGQVVLDVHFDMVPEEMDLSDIENIITLIHKRMVGAVYSA